LAGDDAEADSIAPLISGTLGALLARVRQGCAAGIVALQTGIGSMSADIISVHAAAAQCKPTSVQRLGIRSAASGHRSGASRHRSGVPGFEALQADIVPVQADIRSASRDSRRCERTLFRCLGI
jgi:hypothetical protein